MTGRYQSEQLALLSRAKFSGKTPVYDAVRRRGTWVSVRNHTSPASDAARQAVCTPQQITVQPSCSSCSSSHVCAYEIPCQLHQNARLRSSRLRQVARISPRGRGQPVPDPRYPVPKIERSSDLVQYFLDVANQFLFLFLLMLPSLQWGGGHGPRAPSPLAMPPSALLAASWS